MAAELNTSESVQNHISTVLARANKGFMHASPKFYLYGRCEILRNLTQILYLLPLQL